MLEVCLDFFFLQWNLFCLCGIGNIVMVRSILEWGYYVVKINQFKIIFWNGRYCNGNVC